MKLQEDQKGSETEEKLTIVNFMRWAEITKVTFEEKKEVTLVVITCKLPSFASKPNLILDSPLFSKLIWSELVLN